MNIIFNRLLELTLKRQAYMRFVIRPYLLRPRSYAPPFHIALGRCVCPSYTLSQLDFLAVSSYGCSLIRF
jgi:hypothetical protein